VMVCKVQFGAILETVLSKKTFSAEEKIRIAVAMARANMGKVTVEAFAPEILARYVIDVAWHAKTVIVQRKDATNGGDNVNIPARPVGDAHHFIDLDPPNVTPPPPS